MTHSTNFREYFTAATGNSPFPWQEAMYERFISDRHDNIPSSCDIPTGLGKTSVIAIWLIALAEHPDKMPRRLAYVVNRRTVVDQTTDEVVKLRRNLEEHANLRPLKEKLGSLAISTLRGQFADNREWSTDPSRPAVICGTVDMIGSRLLFGGYRIGFKSRPLHAGFLGQDVLLVHDEAHLEPAFQKLITTVESEQNEGEKSCDLPWPKLRAMALSATTRDEMDEASENNEDRVFRLSEDDCQHSMVKKRIGATKQLVLHSLKNEKKELVDAVITRALKFEQSGQAVLIFLRSVESVGKVADALRKHDKERHWVETLTGTLRGLERDDLVNKPVFQRFLPKSNRDGDLETAEGTAYLVCTSAGEVGVNISADHLVCDLSTFDSMAQRFGRVNRFGDRNDTCVDVVHPVSFDEKKPNPQRKTTLALLQQLDGDVSPYALDQLDVKARADAFAPPPTILPATDILFDAWSMTTIRDKMPGRPPVEPYLHGVAEWEPPQTEVAWREEVDIFKDSLLDRYLPKDLLDDYPLKPHELLKDRSDRVFKGLVEIAKRCPDAPVWLVNNDGSVEVTTIMELAEKNRKNRINGRIVLLPPSVGGLQDGLLNGGSKTTDDVSDRWFDENEKQRRDRVWDDAESPEGMALIRTIDTNPNTDEFDPSENEEEGRSSARRFWHWYVKPRDVENVTRASIEPITWGHHTNDVVSRTRQLVIVLKLPAELNKALILAAELHDLGKRRELWQRGIGNPNPTDWYAKPGKPKNGLRWRPRHLSSYRHEFGSLLDVLDPEQEYLARFKQLDTDMQELVLHVIAAHHGRARPHFPADESIDPVPGSNDRANEQALETPRRFARLQRKYGRWGLAYLESLLRAADWAASAEPTKIEEDNS